MTSLISAAKRCSLFVALSTLLFASGCMHWAQPRGPVSTTLERLQRQEQEVRLHLRNGGVVEYRAAVLRDDSLVESDTRSCIDCSVAVAEIAAVDVRMFNPVVALAFVGMALIIFSPVILMGALFAN